MIDQALEAQAAQQQEQATAEAKYKMLLETIQAAQTLSKQPREGSRTPRRNATLSVHRVGAGCGRIWHRWIAAAILAYWGAPQVGPCDGLTSARGPSLFEIGSTNVWCHTIVVEEIFVSPWVAQLLHCSLSLRHGMIQPKGCLAFCRTGGPRIQTRRQNTAAGIHQLLLLGSADVILHSRPP